MHLVGFQYKKKRCRASLEEHIWIRLTYIHMNCANLMSQKNEYPTGAKMSAINWKIK